MLLSGEACGGKARGRSDVGNSARVPEGQQEPAGPRPRNALFAGFTATMAKSDFPGGLLGLTWAGLAPADRASFTWRPSFRGRDASYLAPPAQIRTCGFPAYGSYLGY
jgi:hypothetical protein